MKIKIKINNSIFFENSDSNYNLLTLRKITKYKRIMKIHSILLLIWIGLFSCQNSTQEKVKKYNIAEIDKLTEEILKSPKNASLYLNRSLLFSENKLYKEAELDAEKAMLLDSTKLDHYRVLADAYFDNNHSNAAIKTIQKAIGRYPEEKGFYLNLAEMQMIVEQYQESAITIEMLLKKLPEDPEGNFLKAQLLKITGDTTQSIDLFKKIIALDADHIQSYMELALYYNKKGESLALDYLKNVLRIDSTYQPALLTRAQFYHFKNQYQQAIQAYQEAIVKQPQNADLNYNFALMYLEKGEEELKKNAKVEAGKSFESAFNYFSNATKFDVQFADAFYYKGLAALKINKKPQAKIAFENALRLQSNLFTITPDRIEQELEKLQ
jgi:tetratricopeptide (TPR) repeat protein